MNGNIMITIVVVLAIVVFVFARQIVRRPVTQISLLLPLILTLAFAGLFLAGHPATEGIVAMIIGAALGVGTGLVSGHVVRVWRDEATGIIFQCGGWRYLVVLVLLLVARVLIRFVLAWSDNAVDETALNVALIAALVGNFVGRDIRTALRALPLAGCSFTRLSAKSDH